MLRNRIKHDVPKEVYEDRLLLYKFLKARNFNVKHSEAMLKKSIQNRKTLQTATLIKDIKPSEVVEKYCAQSFLGYDKEGHPIRFVKMGCIDVKGIFKSTNILHLFLHVLRILEIDREKCKQQTKKLGKPINQSVFIYDMDKFSFAQATNHQAIQYFMKGLTFFQDNYPEMLKRVYVINASVYFTMVYSLIQTILATPLMEKIRVYNQNGWKEELLDCIDADVLPAFLGGTRTDPDGNPLCLTFINYGGIVPESYYVVKDIERTARKPGMKHIRLERQKMISIPVDIEKPTSILRWEFETKCYDIGFGIVFEETSEYLIPVEKFETEIEPFCGMYRCDKAGKYVIVFDNSYSWLHYKDVYYRTWITGSEDI